MGFKDAVFSLFGRPREGSFDQEPSWLALSSPWCSQRYPTRSDPHRLRTVGFGNRLVKDVYTLSTELLYVFFSFMEFFHKLYLRPFPRPHRQRKLWRWSTWHDRRPSSSSRRRHLSCKVTFLFISDLTYPALVAAWLSAGPECFPEDDLDLWAGWSARAL